MFIRMSDVRIVEQTKAMHLAKLMYFGLSGVLQVNINNHITDRTNAMIKNAIKHLIATFMSRKTPLLFSMKFSDIFMNFVFDLPKAKKK